MKGLLRMLFGKSKSSPSISYCAPPAPGWKEKGEEYEVLSKYMKVMTKSQYNKYEDIILGTRQVTCFSEAEIAKLQEKLDKEEAKEQQLYQTAANNNQGIAFEREGKIEEAIAIYEVNLTLKYPALHSYYRLMILYRKKKRYDDEIRIIRQALKVFGKKPNYAREITRLETRLEKALAAKTKAP